MQRIPSQTQSRNNKRYTSYTQFYVELEDKSRYGFGVQVNQSTIIENYLRLLSQVIITRGLVDIERNWR